jgi:hypothetical protein
MLGDCYSSSYFNDIKNARIRSALQRIADETQADLEGFQTVLRDYGATVLRPRLNPHNSILDDMNHRGQIKGQQGVPRSPLQPRDMQMVIGDKLYMVNSDHWSIMQELYRYDSNIDSYVNLVLGIANTSDEVKRRVRCIPAWVWPELAEQGWGNYEDYSQPDYFDRIEPNVAAQVLRHHTTLQPSIDAASMTLVGRDLYIDYMIYHARPPLDKLQTDLITAHHDVRINGLTIGGHNDGVFHTLKPGAIISLREIQNYAETFPGWDVCYLENQSWDKMDGFLKMKRKVQGKWWVPGEEDNDELTEFVETWLQDWVGYAEESVFDVNVFMLDERHVCVSNYNQTAFEFFKKHHIEPIIVPWRHRYFWDGGLHCITLDLYREGVQEDHFPDRRGPVFDVGY